MNEVTCAPAGAYSADTEILARRGWVRLTDTLASDQFAMRNLETKALEWQYPRYFREENFCGELLNFRSQTLDLLVTPDHRMLVSSCPRGVVAEWHEDEWIVRAEALARYATTFSSVPLTAANEATNMLTFRIPSSATAYNEYVVFDGAALRAAREQHGLLQREIGEQVGACITTIGRAETGGTIRLRLAMRLRDILGVDFREHSDKFAFSGMSGDDYAAFMGMWLAEGCVNWHGEAGKRRPSIYVTQASKSRGFVPYRKLLGRLLGFDPAYTGASFYFRHSGLAEYLRGFGHAHEKYVPDEIKAMSPRQLMIFWHYYWLGDGAAGRNRIFTSSPRMADDLQQVAALCGRWATIRFRKPHGSRFSDGRTIAIENDRGSYVIAWHENQEAVWNARRVPYDGKVYRVLMPHGSMYVRRNGNPAWSG